MSHPAVALLVMARIDSADFSLALPLDRKTAAVTESASGDLYVEGWASDWQTDRDDERFEPGAFDAALARFMATNPVVLWNHEIGTPLGQVVDARIEKARGLWVRVRLDRAVPGSWASTLIEKVRRGTLRAFSVGGRFFREGRRIVKVDLRELSIVAVPANPRALFTVVAPTTAYAAAGKAFGMSSAHEDDWPVRVMNARLALVEADLAIAAAELRLRGR